MNIKGLTIRNFRNISDERTFELHPEFTAIIGINGMGKSTILHALRVACGAYFLGIPDVSEKGNIKNKEVRQIEERGILNDEKPVKIEATGTLWDDTRQHTWRRQILKASNTNTSSEADVGVIREFAREKYHTVNDERNDSIGLPVIAFFGTSRAHGAGRNVKTRIGRHIFKDGYQDWYEMKSVTFKYESWLASYDVLKKNEKEYPNTRDAFFEAIKKANPYIQEIEPVNGKLWLKINMEGTESNLLPIDLHSDGIRFFTEMVAELAYRCIILNGYLDREAITGSTGVVMIDELDLHLHPNWQKQVVKNLKEAFPNIQFVVTTHSPFIVQSLSSEELINLDPIQGLEEDPNRYSLEEVAALEMGVKNVERSTQFLEMQKAAAEFFDLVKNAADQELVAKAKAKLDELRIKYNNDPAYVALLESELPKDI